MTSVGSQLSTVPKGLPLLPGNGFKDPTLTNFKKSHVFDVHQGIPVSHDPSIVAPPAMGAIEAPTMAPMPTAEITPVQPAWVAFDRKVLRFNCFFKEAVNESRLENYRIRNCVLYYYLEDDSMHISEPKVENSGIPQVCALNVLAPWSSAGAVASRRRATRAGWRAPAMRERRPSAGRAPAGRRRIASNGWPIDAHLGRAAVVAHVPVLWP